jgi:hypothetical protein
MVLLGLLNLGLLTLLSLMAIPFGDPANLLYHNVPLIDAVGFDDRVLQSVFGTVLIAYFGHVYVSQVAQGILPREPSGRALIWGSIAGIASSIVLFVGWVLAVSAALGVDGLAGRSGTALSPLAERLGFGAQVVGSILAFSLLGMSLIRNQNVLYHLVRERLPARTAADSADDSASSRAGPSGLDLATILDLPDDQRQIVAVVARRGEAGVAELAAELGRNERAVLLTLGVLVGRDLVRRSGHRRYRTAWAPRRPRQLTDTTRPALSEPDSPIRRGRSALDAGFGRLRGLLLAEPGRFLLGVSPIVATFLVTEWLLVVDKASYTRPLSVAGVIIVSLLAGMFPVLLLAASRRRGDFVPGLVLRFLGHPVVVVGIYLLYMVGLLAHGLVIWDDPVERASALVAGVLMLVTTAAMLRLGAFTPRVVVELRDDRRPSGRAMFAVTAHGRPVVAEAKLEYPSGDRSVRTAAGQVPAFSTLRSATFQLPGTDSGELKVWAHRVRADGESEPLPALVEVSSGEDGWWIDLGSAGGQASLPIDGPSKVEILLNDPETRL